jgi:hypothetical protein
VVENGHQVFHLKANGKSAPDVRQRHYLGRLWVCDYVLDDYFHSLEHNYEEIAKTTTKVADGNKEESIQEGYVTSQSHLPIRQEKYNARHDMANCQTCIELEKNCVTYYEFIRNPEKEEAAKKKADKLRPIVMERMRILQSAHVSYVSKFFEEQKAEIQKIHAEQPLSSGDEDNRHPRPPPKNRRRYRKQKTKKINDSE